MTPVPYQSPWCELTHYLTKTLLHDKIIAVVTTNNTQPRDGHLFPTIQEAKNWLKDNGFKRK